MGVSNSNNCKVKKRFLSKREASNTFMTTSGFLVAIYSLEINSSIEKVDSEYIPGKSIMSIV